MRQSSLRTLPERIADARMLNVLEAAARRCGRVADVVTRYTELTRDHPQLHGRIKRLQRTKVG